MLKRGIYLFLTIFLIFMFAGCGNNTSVDNSSENTTQSENVKENLDSQKEIEQLKDNDSIKIAVVYFSATGNTKMIAEYIAEEFNTDTYQIIPEQEYTSEDLDWTDSNSRASVEHNSPDFRPEIAGELPDLSSYDTIFIGYPIWWGEAPNIVKGFVENVDFSDKTVIPFCTSASSDIGSSGENLAELTEGATWLEGQRFSSNVEKSDVIEWVNGLAIN